VVYRGEGLAGEESRRRSGVDRGKEDEFELSPCGGPFLLLAILKIDVTIMAIVVARCSMSIT
jgi:hypothetical protein